MLQAIQESPEYLQCIEKITHLQNLIELEEKKLFEVMKTIKSTNNNITNIISNLSL